MAQKCGMEQGIREPQGGAHGLATGHPIHVMYCMGFGLQPENNLLFLLFPY